MNTRAMLAVLTVGLLCGCVQTMPQAENSFARPAGGRMGLPAPQPETAPTVASPSMPQSGGY
jgi:hypothetical protein